MAPDIESPGNPRIQRLARLKHRRARDSESIFVVEEARILDRAIGSGHQPIELFWSPELASRPDDVDVPAVTVSVTAANRASYRGRSTGLIALFPYFTTSLADLAVPSDALFAVAEGLEKPGNLGAIMRIGDGAGVDGVIVVDRNADPFNPNVVRSSTGALFTVPLAVTASVAELATWLEAAGVASTAAVPGGESTLWATDLRGRRALWIGAEAKGLTPSALEVATSQVTIPMAGVADSLNSSVAAALIIYESIRQRYETDH